MPNTGPTMEDRRQAALAALTAFREARDETDGNDADIRDLLTDLAHLSDAMDDAREGAAALDSASVHYEIEAADEAAREDFRATHAAALAPRIVVGCDLCSGTEHVTSDCPDR